MPSVSAATGDKTAEVQSTQPVLPSAPYGFLRLKPSLDVLQQWARIMVPVVKGASNSSSGAAYEDEDGDAQVAAASAAASRKLERANLDGQDFVCWPQPQQPLNNSQGQATPAVIVCCAKVSSKTTHKPAHAACMV